MNFFRSRVQLGTRMGNASLVFLFQLAFSDIIHIIRYNAIRRHRRWLYLAKIPEIFMKA